MATIDVLDATSATVALEKPNANGQGTMATSRPVVIASNQSAVPISAASLPLPTGAATEATLTAQSAKLPASLGIKTAAGSFSVALASDGTLPLPTGAATEATLLAQSAKLPASLGAKTGALSFSVVPNTDTAFSVTGTFWQATQPVSAATLPLPTGASTSALQTTMNTTLGSPFQAGGALGAGSAIIGKVGIDQTTPGTTNLVAAGQNGTWNITNISGTVSLPTGAATAAKQPALGTAGTPSADYLSVQNAAATPMFAVGNIAGAATDSGNPVKVGGVYNSVIPTYTTGQRGDMQIGSRGSLNITILGSGTSTAAVCIGTQQDASSNATGTLAVQAQPLAYNGSTWDRVRGNVDGQVNQPHAMTGSRWQYAAASGGIVNTTTAVTIIAAGGASVRNYITGIQIFAGALGAATEIAIRDGAAGTVIWRGFISTSGASAIDILFPAPLKGSANTLLEVVTLTASITGAVYFNAQGYTGI